MISCSERKQLGMPRQILIYVTLCHYVSNLNIFRITVEVMFQDGKTDASREGVLQEH